MLRGDVLIIDDKHYTFDTLNTVPDRLRWTVKGEHFFEECNSTFFFGKESFLSNHHPSKFVEGGKTYSCVEEYYLEKKALFFHDEATASAIRTARRPGAMKALSRRIKGVDDKKWLPIARSTMTKACSLKFGQNENLRNKLLHSRGLLVEANKKDCFFSCGLSLADPNIKETSRWLGENVLGIILTQLREHFRNSST